MGYKVFGTCLTGSRLYLGGLLTSRWHKSQALSLTLSSSTLRQGTLGKFWCTAAEDMISLGLFVLVPDLEANGSPAEQEAWQICI